MNQKMIVPVLVTANLLLVLVCALSWWFNSDKQKVAFVNSPKVLSQYMGMKETQEIYQNKIADRQAKLDSLQAEIEEREALFLETYKSLSAKDRQQTELSLNKSKQSFVKQKEEWEKEVTVEGNKLTQGMLNQINTYIENYAKEQGYVLVHGSTSTGNILYASRSVDITENIIAGLNEQYKK